VPVSGGRDSAKEARLLAEGDDGLGGSTDSYFGSVDAIELNAASAASIVDETAILFANGQGDAAEIGLRAAMEEDQLGDSTETAWLMLFELVRQRGDKAGFEQLTMQYALRFENSAPAWFDYLTGPAVPRVEPKSGAPVVRLPQVIDANIVRPLEELKTLAATHTSLTLDASSTRAIDLVGAELLLRVINAFKRATHELIVLGAENLITPLRAILEPGRRDASDAAWMLLLEIHRLLNRQADFEETGIQYCITFEVSPPSWEPAPPNLKTRAASLTPVAGALDPHLADPLDWRGEIGNDGEPWFGKLLLSARTNNRLSVECAHLRRMSFSAASVLLSVVIRMQQGGAAVEFRNVNYLVGTLLRLMGVSAVAEIQVRRT
jgi:anti-anti-sigma regulatory factor